VFFFFSSRRRHTRFSRDWSSDVCSSDLEFPLLPHRQWVAKRLVLENGGVCPPSLLHTGSNLPLDAVVQGLGRAPSTHQAHRRREEIGVRERGYLAQRWYSEFQAVGFHRGGCGLRA